MMEHSTNLDFLFIISIAVIFASLSVALTKDLFYSIISFGLFSMFCCVSYVLMDAPDVAMTEAALGACVTTVIMLKLAIDTSFIYRKELRKYNQIPALIICLIFGAALVYAGLDLHQFGDSTSPVHTNVSGYYHENTYKEIGITSYVAAILGSYRGYDTFGETIVIFTGGICAMFILSILQHSKTVIFKGNMIIETCSKISAYIILPFVFYVQICGTSSPGGGFQAGAILASLIIGLNLSYGYRIDTKHLTSLAAIGVLIYALPGLYSIASGYNFLDYNSLPFGAKSQKIGIEIVELGIAVNVSSTLALLYYAFFTTKVTNVSSSSKV